MAAALAAAAISPATFAACSSPEVTFKSAVVSRGDRDDFERELKRSVERACGWWGETYNGKYIVTIEDSRGPSITLVPAWRGDPGEMLFRANTVRNGHAAIQHEVMHLFAPNANRFLAEGLAVYAHDRLGGGKAYPNNGVDLHEAAKPFAARADMAALERVATPTPLQQPGLDESDAYIVAGSFVRFLIDRDGLDKFRALYALTPLVSRARNAGDPLRWATIYGAGFPALVAAWREALP